MYLRRLIVASGGAETIVYRVTATERAVHILYIILSSSSSFCCYYYYYYYYVSQPTKTQCFVVVVIIVFYYLRFRERDETRISFIPDPTHRILYARRRPPIIEVIRVHRVIRHSSVVTLESNFLHDCGLCPVISRRSSGARATDVYDYEITRFNFRRDTRRAQDTHIQATLQFRT